MAGYDPKRPRPAAGDDDPPPVEALLDPAPPDGPEVLPATPEPAAAEPSSVEPAAAEPSAPVEPSADASPVDVSGSAGPGAPVGRDDPAVRRDDPAPAPPRHLRPVPDGGSDVPVAERPAEATANRAVVLVGVLGTAAVAVAVAVVVMRRRR